MAEMNGREEMGVIFFDSKNVPAAATVNKRFVLEFCKVYCCMLPEVNASGQRTDRCSICGRYRHRKHVVYYMCRLPNAVLVSSTSTSTKKTRLYNIIRLKKGPRYMTVRPQPDCLGHTHKTHAILRRKDAQKHNQVPSQ